MGKCLCHPEKESNYVCLKDNVYLCDECLKCRNPDIYCKFRESCPIWFMDKKGFKDEGIPTDQYEIVFEPDGKKVVVPEGTTLLKAAQMAGVHLNASCNGKGSCGKCKLIITSGYYETVDTPLLSDSEKENRYVLACLTKVHGDITARIPEETLEKKLKVAGMGIDATARLKGLVKDITPMLEDIPLELSPPMIDGSIMAATSGHNEQAACGDDVINRIVCAEKEGVKKLSRMALATINNLIGEALDSVGAPKEDIKNVVLSGNTTMTHLLLGIEPRYIRRSPYIPTVSEFPILKAVNVGLKVNPGAAVFIMPGPASYVGGDIVSGMIYTGLHREDPLTLFIDVGTNGEIVLGNKDWLMTASCSAGPAFEGGGIRWGMRAEEGAVEKVTIHPDTFEPALGIIGDVPPRGICGSGMIDLISEMLLCGIIDPRGKFALDPSHPRMMKDEYDTAYVLAFAEDTAMQRDLTFTESDINSLVLSKGAIYAGFTVLLAEAGLDFSMVDRIWVAGGFGQFLDIDKAVTIGMLPDIDRAKFEYLGNSSIGGAYMALLSGQYRKEARRISNNMTYIDFSSNSRFMDEFTSALFLPHTNQNAFPSVKIKTGKLKLYT